MPIKVLMLLALAYSFTIAAIAMLAGAFSTLKPRGIAVTRNEFPQTRTP